MAITLSTQIPQLLFSSAIPDLAIATDTDGEVEIALTSFWGAWRPQRLASLADLYNAV